MLTIRQLRAWATKHKPIYIQLYLDRSFWCKPNREEFEKLISKLYREYCNDNFVMLDAWDEGANYHWHCAGVKISLEEHYWTLDWGKMYGKTWKDKLPLPKRHAKKYNSKYKSECCSEYLMLDFYEL